MSKPLRTAGIVAGIVALWVAVLTWVAWSHYVAFDGAAYSTGFVDWLRQGGPMVMPERVPAWWVFFHVAGPLVGALVAPEMLAGAYERRPRSVRNIRIRLAAVIAP